MRLQLVLSLTLATLLLAACDSGGKSAEQAAESPPSRLMEPQRNALDKVRGVDNTVQQQAQEQQQEANRQAE